MSSAIRYTAQRYGSNEWLSLDLPLTTEGPWETYNGYETMEASISPEVGLSVAEDGRPIIEPWGTWIHAESPDERLWTGFVESVDVTDNEMTITVRDWLGYLDGMILSTRIWGVNDDPAELARQIWTQLQKFKGGNLGVSVVGTTPVRLGSDSEDKANALKATMKARKKTLDAKTKQVNAKQAEIKRIGGPMDRKIRTLEGQRKVLTRAYELKVRAKAPKPEINAAKALVDAKSNEIQAERNKRAAAIGNRDFELEDLRDQEASLRVTYDAANDAYQKAQDVVEADGGAWKVLPEDLPDAWSTLNDLAEDAPFDFVASTERTTGGPKLKLEIFYPSIGSVRDDLVFESGRNISTMPQVQRSDKYASELIATGAGQGTGDDAQTLRVTVSEDDPRMRRTEVFSDPDIKHKTVLTTRARKELAEYRVDLTIPEIRVFETPNTPIGSWRAGDIITVKLEDVPHFGRVVVKHRIKSWQRSGESEAVLRLEPTLAL